MTTTNAWLNRACIEWQRKLQTWHVWILVFETVGSRHLDISARFREMLAGVWLTGTGGTIGKSWSLIKISPQSLDLPEELEGTKAWLIDETTILLDWLVRRSLHGLCFLHVHLVCRHPWGKSKVEPVEPWTISEGYEKYIYFVPIHKQPNISKVVCQMLAQ